jgi:hypothetical protein
MRRRNLRLVRPAGGDGDQADACRRPEWILRFARVARVTAATILILSFGVPIFLAVAYLLALIFLEGQPFKMLLGAFILVVLLPVSALFGWRAWQASLADRQRPEWLREP